MKGAVWGAPSGRRGGVFGKSVPSKMDVGGTWAGCGRDVTFGESAGIGAGGGESSGGGQWDRRRAAARRGGA